MVLWPLTFLEFHVVIHKFSLQVKYFTATNSPLVLQANYAHCPSSYYCKATIDTAGGPPGDRKGLIKLQDALTPACGLSVRDTHSAGDNSRMGRWPRGPLRLGYCSSIRHRGPECFWMDMQHLIDQRGEEGLNGHVMVRGGQTMNDVFVCGGVTHFRTACSTPVLALTAER